MSERALTYNPNAAAGEAVSRLILEMGWKKVAAPPPHEHLGPFLREKELGWPPSGIRPGRRDASGKLVTITTNCCGVDFDLGLAHENDLDRIWLGYCQKCGQAYLWPTT